jgi:uroporphyrinogen decarboxylase
VRSRQLVEKTLEFDSPTRIPRHVWLLPWAEKKYPDFIKKLRRDYPDDIVIAPAAYKTQIPVTGDRYSKGIYVDEWGCVFSNEQEGIIGIVKKPLIEDWQDVYDFQPPVSLLEVDREAVNRFCRSTDKYVLSGSIPRPFERFQFIRTMEQALMDLILQPPELSILLDSLHSFYCKEIEVWATTEVDAIAFMDDWGTQNALVASPEIFRRFFKPMYKDYAEIAHQYGKKIFMHSDGFILDIIQDLIEVGIDALNSQVFCMGLEEMGRRFSGKLTFWGEIDRQYILSQGTEEEVLAAVRSFYDSLYKGGGVIAQCEFGLEAKPENILTVFKTFDSIQL